jgi:hypothetical protein
MIPQPAGGLHCAVYPSFATPDVLPTLPALYCTLIFGCLCPERQTYLDFINKRALCNLSFSLGLAKQESEKEIKKEGGRKSSCLLWNIVAG